MVALQYILKKENTYQIFFTPVSLQHFLKGINREHVRSLNPLG